MIHAIESPIRAPKIGLDFTSTEFEAQGPMSVQNAVTVGRPWQFRKVYQNRMRADYPSYLISTLNVPESGFRTEYFQSIADDLLMRFYPRTCESCGKAMTGRVQTRPYVVKCGSCRTEKSLLADTPFRNTRLRMWQIGWVVDESLKRAPGVLTAADIQRSLGVRYSSALRLKRRTQVFCAQHLPRVRDLMRAELTERFRGVTLPQPDRANIKQDITAELADKRIPQTDTIALFSSRGTANKGRKKHKNRGQTASIYRADSLGGDQVGTLVSALSWAGGPVLLDSVPDQRAHTLLPLIERVVPRGVPLFSDFGYDWYSAHNRAGHRMVNHALPARRGKGKSKFRWSQCGIHTNAVEGRQGVVKGAFRQYRYFAPRFSSLYLAEYSFWSGVRYYGIQQLAVAPQGQAVTQAGIGTVAEATGREGHGSVDYGVEGLVLIPDRK